MSFNGCSHVGHDGLEHQESKEGSRVRLGWKPAWDQQGIRSKSSSHHLPPSPDTGTCDLTKYIHKVNKIYMASKFTLKTTRPTVVFCKVIIVGPWKCLRKDKKEVWEDCRWPFETRAPWIANHSRSRDGVFDVLTEETGWSLVSLTPLFCRKAWC